MFKGTFPKAELGDVLSGIDVLAIPSRWYENSPLVLLYALATKTPVVVTDMKGMSEFVRNGHNGYTFPKDNVKHLSCIMQNIVDNPQTLIRLSNNADYAKDVMDHAENVQDIYLRVLGNSGTG
jgi:glycosyltransferase involved in cell wall biosynthesis